MKRHKSNSIIMCIFEIIVGILLLISPIRFTAGIIIAAGIILVVTGLMSIIRYFRTDPFDAAYTQSLTQGLIFIIAGIFCVLRSQWFISAFPLLMIIYGVAILLVGIHKIQLTVDIIRVRNGRWYLAAISAALSIVCAVIIFSNPFSTVTTLWMFAGISLIVEAIIDLIVHIFTAKHNTPNAV